MVLDAARSSPSAHLAARLRPSSTSNPGTIPAVSTPFLNNAGAIGHGSLILGGGVGPVFDPGPVIETGPVVSAGTLGDAVPIVAGGASGGAVLDSSVLDSSVLVSSGQFHTGGVINPHTPLDGMILANPAILDDLTAVWPPVPDGVPREQVGVPIAPADPVTDTMLFEDHLDAARKYFLPRYRLGTETVSGRQQFRMAFQEAGEGWVLNAFLEKHAAPEIELQARTASELPHEVYVIMRYRLPVGGDRAPGLQKEHIFQTVVPVEGGLQISLAVSTAERDEIFMALTQAHHATTLIVRRITRVAVLTGGSGTTWPGNIMFLQPELAVIDHPLPIVNVDPDEPLPILNGSSHVIVKPDVLGGSPPVASGVESVLGSLNTFNSVVVRSRGGRPSGLVLEGRLQERTPLLRPANEAELAAGIWWDPSPPRYQVVTRTLDDPVEPEPFIFPFELHRYIYQGLTGTTGPDAQSVRRQVVWQGAAHGYYQDASQKQLFYYLPDSFKLARRTNPPFYPLMTVHLDAPDDSLESLVVTLDYIARPYVDLARLEAAREELRQFVPASLEAEPEFQPLVAAETPLFNLALPRADTSTGPFQPREGASVHLRDGIMDSLTLTPAQFQAVFDALMGGSTILLRGEVVVNMGTGATEAPIPFEARLDDLIGDLLTYREAVAADGLDVTIQNAIESPLTIQHLNARLYNEAGVRPADFGGVAFPVDLAPGAEITGRLTFADAPGDTPSYEGYHALLEAVDGVTVKPDKSLVWDAILDPTTVASYLTELTIKTFDFIFQPPAGDPNRQVLAIVVDFEHGGSIELNPSTLEVKALLRQDIDDYVVRNITRPHFSYRRTVVRRSGQQRDAAWLPYDSDRLFIDLQGLD